MRNGYVIGGEKLSDQQFSDKYWLAGNAEYQFHSMDIGDGLDERQQLLINNDRALFEAIKWHFDRSMERTSNIEKETKLKLKVIKRAIATLSVINVAIVGMLAKIMHS